MFHYKLLFMTFVVKHRPIVLHEKFNNLFNTFTKLLSGIIIIISSSSSSSKKGKK